MTCNLKEKFKAAEAAMRVAFDAALEHQDDFDNSETVTDVWHMYSNWRRTIKSVPDLPEHSHDTANSTPYSFGVDLPPTTLPDGSYDPDHNISIDTAAAADNTVTFAPPNGDWGEYMSTGDMITFTNANSTGTVGIPAEPQVTKVDPEQNAADLNDRDGV